MKMPALQFYPGDWRKDPGVQALGYFERGVWFEIICLMHESSERGVLLLNGNPMPDAALANILGLDNQILASTLTTLLTYGVAKRRETDGAVYSKRMVRDENLCQIRRESGKKGGNPVLLNQNSTTGVKQVPTPSSSSSSSSSEETIRTPPAPKGENVDSYFTDFWLSWPASQRKVAKSKCAEFWKRHKLDAMAVEIIDHVNTMKSSEQWRAGFEPAPMTYLNQRRWEDGNPAAKETAESEWSPETKRKAFSWKMSGLPMEEFVP